MLAVHFAVAASSGQAQRGMETAAELRPELDKIDGFVSVEWFQSVGRSEVHLALSYWPTKPAISVWRNQAYHRDGQHEGRSSAFSNYLVRVVSVVPNYNFQDRAETLGFQRGPVVSPDVLAPPC